MVPAGVFILLLALLRAMHRGSSRTTTILYIVSLIAIILLFNHHLTDSIGLSF